MTDALRYLTERDVVSVLDIHRAIDALHAMLVAQGKDQARNLPKALATWGDGSSMHALGSVQTGADTPASRPGFTPRRAAGPCSACSMPAPVSCAPSLLSLIHI